MLKNFVDYWEAELLVDWILKTGAADYLVGEGGVQSKGMKATEWWWTALGDGKKG
jgi:hypothetical protein